MRRGRFIITPLSSQNQDADISLRTEPAGPHMPDRMFTRTQENLLNREEFGQSPGMRPEVRLESMAPLEDGNHELEHNKAAVSIEHMSLRGNLLMPSHPQYSPPKLSPSFAEQRQEEGLALQETPVFRPMEPVHPHRRQTSPVAGNRQNASPVQNPSNFEEGRLIPMHLITSLQDSLCAKFTEMLQMHGSVMEEMAARDMRRDEQMSILMAQNLELVRCVTRLQCEQAALQEKTATMQRWQK